MRTSLYLVVLHLWSVCFASSPDAVGQDEEFLPYSEATDLSLHEYRQLSSSYYSSKFVDSTQSYDGYQQAWRLLGFYIDCSQRGRNDNDSRDHNSHDNQDHKSNSRCVRYLIWAAYIDPNYQGGGIGEYMHYNSYYKKWDTRPCSTHGNGRCAPMDCHMTNTTTWKLLGVYKEEQYASEWFEQLFKHAGYCLWNYKTYQWMQTYREAWPEGCVQTNTKTPSGRYLYTDLKPTVGGNMTLALYSDSDCRIEYKYATAGSVLQGHYLTGNAAKLFNDAMEPYKYCQPCRAAAIRSSYGSSYGSNRRRLEDDPNEGYFQCDDDAGYTNVNQCMKFRTHTTLFPMTMRDVEDATTQGGMLPINIAGTVYGQSASYRPVEVKIMEYEEELDMPIAGIIVASGSVVFGVGAILLGTIIMWIMRRRYQAQSIASSEPLLSTDDHATIGSTMSSDSVHIYHLHGERKQVTNANTNVNNALPPFQ